MSGLSAPRGRRAGSLGLFDMWRLPLWELRQPKPGFRHNREPTIVCHRFPIKDGLTFNRAWALTFVKPNPLLELVRVVCR